MRSGLPKVRTVRRILGFGAQINWCVHNNNLRNILRGLVERVYRVNTTQGLRPPPRPDPGEYARIMGPAKAAVSRWLSRSVPVDYDTFVEYYRGRRKTIYRAAADSLMHNPVCRADSNLKTFVKAEKVNLTKKPDPAPRVIQPRDPRYNVEVGRYLRPLEKPVYRAVARAWGGRTILKGLNAEDTAGALRRKWEEFDQPVALGLDASRFDQHVSDQALEWEHSIYLGCFSGAERTRLARLLGWQIDNRGTARLPEAKVSYRVRGCRMSGDMNTSTGNCLLMSMMVWQWAQVCGVKCSLANNGDDCVVFMEKRDLGVFCNGLDEFFVRLGFTLTSEDPAYTFEHIEFCQCRPVFDGLRWIMVRNFNVSVSKDLVTLIDVDKSVEKWAGAVGDCGLSLTGGLPVLQDFYTCLRASGPKRYRAGPDASYFGEGFKMMAGDLDRQYRPILPAARVSFALAFGILPDEQIEMEKFLRASPLPKRLITVEDHPSIWYK